MRNIVHDFGFIDGFVLRVLIHNQFLVCFDCINFFLSFSVLDEVEVIVERFVFFIGLIIVNYQPSSIGEFFLHDVF